MKKPEFLLRDVNTYNNHIHQILKILAEEPLTHIEALGVLDMVRDEIHAQRFGMEPE